MADEMSLKVRTEWNDTVRSVSIPFKSLKNPHWEWSSVGGQFFMYGLVDCDQLTDGDLGHDCAKSPGRQPHELRVCITRKGNWRSFDRLMRLVGDQPPSPGPEGRLEALKRTAAANMLDAMESREELHRKLDEILNTAPSEDARAITTVINRMFRALPRRPHRT